jgi:hypothetical protein
VRPRAHAQAHAQRPPRPSPPPPLPPSPHSFVIADVDGFSQHVLPVVYRHNKLPSFIRSLNFYAFRKQNAGSNVAPIYAHTLFRRGHPENLPLIRPRRGNNA